MGNNVSLLIEDIINKKLKGSSPIAIRTAQAILADIETLHSSKNVSGKLKLASQELGSEIIRSRPSNVSLRNSVRSVLYKIEKIDDDDDDRILEVIRGNASAFINSVNSSLENISYLGANIIQDGDIILTSSYSSTVKEIINVAHNFLDKIFKVYVTETRPRYQGVKMVKELLELGIDTTLITDSSTRHLMKEMDLIIVGADTVSSDGSVITKIGSSQIALAAHEARIPFYVAVPTFKFSEDTLSGVMVSIEEGDPHEVLKGSDLEYEFNNPHFHVRNPTFDATPPEYIRGLITELYIMSPFSVGEFLARKTGVIR